MLHDFVKSHCFERSKVKKTKVMRRASLAFSQDLHNCTLVKSAMFALAQMHGPSGDIECLSSVQRQ